MWCMWTWCPVLIVMFHALVVAGDLTFITLGDWGSGIPNQTAVAQAMAGQASLTHPSFLLTTGDNFYPDGVTSVTDEKWDIYYRDVYTSPDLRIPWYASLGNHDYNSNGSPQAQIDFDLQDRDRRWVMPDTNYTVSYDICTGKALTGEFAAITTAQAKQECGAGYQGILSVVVVNTIFLVSDESGIPYQNGSHLPANATDRAAVATAHLQWIDSSLTQLGSDPDLAFLLVSGHYPILSNGGHSNTTAVNNHAVTSMQDTFLPILERHKVDAYLSGHDHSLQHLRVPGYSVNLFVSGSGGNVDSLPYNFDNTFFNKSTFGFAMHTATSQLLTTWFVDEGGAVLYTTSQRIQRSPGGGGRGDDDGLTSAQIFWIIVLVIAGLGLLVMVSCCLVRVSRNLRAKAERRMIKERLRMEVLVAKKQGLWQVEDEAEQSLRRLNVSDEDTDHDEEHGAVLLASLSPS